MMNELYLTSESFRTLSTNFWKREYLKRNDQNPVFLDMEMISEWFNRLTLSYLATPSASYKSRTQLQQLRSVMVKPALASKTEK